MVAMRKKVGTVLCWVGKIEYFCALKWHFGALGITKIHKKYEKTSFLTLKSY